MNKKLRGASPTSYQSLPSEPAIANAPVKHVKQMKPTFTKCPHPFKKDKL